MRTSRFGEAGRLVFSPWRSRPRVEASASRSGPHRSRPDPVGEAFSLARTPGVTRAVRRDSSGRAYSSDEVLRGDHAS